MLRKFLNFLLSFSFAPSLSMLIPKKGDNIKSPITATELPYRDLTIWNLNVSYDLDNVGKSELFLVLAVKIWVESLTKYF